MDYSKMTNDEYDSILQKIMLEEIHNLFSIPGVYEAISDEFHNEVLDTWASQHPELYDDE